MVSVIRHSELEIAKLTTHRLLLVLWLTLIQFIPSISLHADTTNIITGKVIGVTDGDTITVLDSTNTQHKIRLSGIDAPERKQAFGTQAKKALSGKVFGKDVRIEWKSRDRYGRIVGDVYFNDRWINLEMIQDGFAWHYKQYSKDDRLADAEDKARAEKKGLWIDTEHVAPWEFRRAKRK